MTQAKNKLHNGWLLSGAGNTFAIELFHGPAAKNEINNLQAKKICQQYKVDGYLGLLELGPQEFTWNFFNSDGSQAEFCGNAARCAQEYLWQKKQIKQAKHKTIAGLVLSWTEASAHWVRMPQPRIINEKTQIEIDGHLWTGFYCNTGVPHFVLEQTKLRHDVWIEVSKKIRTHHEFGKLGTNVTWVNKKNDHLKAVTFERGVEDFTEACGTGALAAALWWKSKETTKQNFEISMPGGVLNVIVNEAGWLMTGPVEKLGDWSLIEKN